MSLRSSYLLPPSGEHCVRRYCTQPANSETQWNVYTRSVRDYRTLATHHALSRTDLRQRKPAEARPVVGARKEAADAALAYRPRLPRHRSGCRGWAPPSAMDKEEASHASTMVSIGGRPAGFYHRRWRSGRRLMPDLRAARLMAGACSTHWNRHAVRKGALNDGGSPPMSADSSIRPAEHENAKRPSSLLPSCGELQCTLTSFSQRCISAAMAASIRTSGDGFRTRRVPSYVRTCVSAAGFRSRGYLFGSWSRLVSSHRVDEVA
jgi:hypothetical protein